MLTLKEKNIVHVPVYLTNKVFSPDSFIYDDNVLLMYVILCELLVDQM